MAYFLVDKLENVSAAVKVEKKVSILLGAAKVDQQAAQMDENLAAKMATFSAAMWVAAWAVT